MRATDSSNKQLEKVRLIVRVIFEHFMKRKEIHHSYSKDRGFYMWAARGYVLNLKEKDHHISRETPVTYVDQ